MKRLFGQQASHKFIETCLYSNCKKRIQNQTCDRLHFEKKQVFFKQATEAKKNAETSLQNFQMQKQVNIAQELTGHAATYLDLGKDSAALVLYQQALESLHEYDTIPLYQEIEEKMQSID